ncbi:hypothetical protein JCM19233_6306 [Vibrio astriarenae]|nr:hypothetical protein JCM19233_6306 [Vibrio sp. C7]
MKAVPTGLAIAMLASAQHAAASEPYYFGDIGSSTPKAWEEIDKTGIDFLPNDDLYPVFLPHDIMQRYQSVRL